MGIGREVADAYIDVHGDLSSFRRDLQGADAAMRDAAFESADSFSDAWGKRIESDVHGKWGSIVSAMYSEKQIDWDRMFGEFNPRSLDDAREKVAAFLEVMQEAHTFAKDEEGNEIDLGPKFDDEQARKMLARMDDVLAGMRKQEDHQRRLIELQQDLTRMQDEESLKRLEDGRIQDAIGKARENLARAEEEAHRENERWMQRRAKTMQEAIELNKAWARTFEGISKNNAIKNLNEDFEKLSKSITHSDIGKWGNRLEGDFQRMAQRVREVSGAMLEQRRISDEDAAAMVARVDAFIRVENEKSKAMRDALDETNRLRAAQDRYNESLAGMARNFHFAELEGHFRKLAAAMDSNDWSAFAKGAKDMDEFKDNVMHAATEMHRLGRMGDGELRLIGRRMVEVAANAAKFNVSFRDAGDAADDADGKFGKLRGTFGRLAGIFGKLSALTKGLREHLGGFAGLNVMGDLIQGGLDFIHNLDRIAVKLSITTLRLGTMAAVGASAFAELVTIAADLGNIIGGLAVLAPSFLVGAAIGVGVLSAALKDTEKVLADLKPAFAKLQDDISSDFWKEAAGPIREAVKALMPIINNPKGTSTARSLGILVGKLATAFKNIPANKINTMFDRMNRAIDILGNAMAPLIRAFTTLGVVGSKYFERFATWIVKLADQFDKFVQRSAANGDLDKWINNAIDGLKDLARVVDGAMGIFNALNDAAKRAGFGGLKTLADALQDTATAMQKMAFQKTLTTYLEGARRLTLKVAAALRGLGPAAESFAATAKVALGNIGDAVSKLIGYIGDIFENPRFQKGVRDFTDGIRIAVEHLEPAIKPFGDSLGHALELLGKIIVSVADIVTAFEVTLGPVLDRISEQLGTLVKPLSDTAQNFIRQMGPPLDALNRVVITPIVTIVREKLLPAVNRFFEKLSPILTKIIEDLGPVFVKIVEAMPNAIDLITEILPLIGKLIEILTPVVIAAVAVGVEKLGQAMGGLATGLKILKGELPLDLNLDIFRSINPDKVATDAEKSRQKIAENLDPKNQGNVGWAKVLADLFWGAPPDVFWSDVWNMIGPTDEGIANLKKDFEGVQAKIVNDWDAVWSGKADRQFADMLIQWFPGQADFINGVTGWIDDVFTGKWFGEAKDNIVKMWDDTWKEGGNVDQLEATVNGWLNTNVFEPFGRAMDSIGKLIPESFKSDVSEWGLGPAVVNWINNDIMPEIGKGFEEGWKNIAEGRWGSSVEGAAKWEGFWKDWNEWWGSVVDFDQQISATIRKWWEDNVTTPLGKAWDEAWKNLGNFFNGNGGGGGRGDNNGQDAWNSFWGGFEGMFKDAKNANADISKTVNDWLETNVWKPIGDWFKNLDWGKIGDDLWNGFIAGITGKDVNAWEKIASGFTGWVEDMKDFFGIKSPSTLMFDIASNIVTGFLNGFGGLGEKVGEKWEEIKTWISTKAEEIKTNINLWIEERKKDWNDFWGSFGTTVATKWEELKTTLATKFEEIKTALGTWIEERKTDWNNFWGSFGTTVSTKWEEFRTTINTKIEEIKTALNKWIEERKTDWSNFWGSFGQTVKTKWEEFRASIATKIEEIKTALNTWIEDRKRDWNNFWGSFGTTVRTKWEEFRAAIATKVEEIKTSIRVFGETVKRKWDEFWGGIGTTLRTKWTEFKTTVTTKGQEVIDWFKGLPQKLVDAMGNLWDRFLSVGGDIWGGLKKGIEDGWSWVTGAAKSLADSAYTAAQEALDSHSPSRLFRKLGRGTGQGLALGIRDMDSDVVAAGGSMVQGLQRGLEDRMDPLLNTLQTITAAVADTVTADLSKSVMYSTGRDAAQGLADGLKANRSAVHTALGNLGAFTMPSSQIAVGGSFAGLAVGRPTTDVTPGRSVTIAEGAIKIETPTQSPELVAAKVIDKFVNYSTF